MGKAWGPQPQKEEEVRAWKVVEIPVDSSTDGLAGNFQNPCRENSRADHAGLMYHEAFGRGFKKLQDGYRRNEF